MTLDYLNKHLKGTTSMFAIRVHFVPIPVLANTIPSVRKKYEASNDWASL